MRFVIFFLTVAVLAGCCTSKRVNESTCTSSGIVRDFSGLDGCKLLIELDNGDLLNPAELPEGATLTPGERLIFSFEILEGYISTCMSEKYIVKITCLKPWDPSLAWCADVSNPFDVPWMNDAFDRLNPVQIIKFRKEGQAWYLFRAIDQQYLYDCRGNLLCSGDNSSDDTCYQDHIAPLGKGKIIWQGEGVWD